MIRIAYDPIYKHPLPAHHRFPMMKYELIPEQLVYEGTATEEQFFSPDWMSENLIREVHDQDYIAQLQAGTISRKAARRIGFPYSEQLLKREFCITYGTIQAAISAMDTGIAFNVAGGTHHASKDTGEGYCIFNDIAVGANYLLRHMKMRQILVIDLDVHQGNGTASIFKEEPRVFTFSMHGARNFPHTKDFSDLDLPLPEGTKDEYYLSLLGDYLPYLVQKVNPDFIFYQAGVDILANDKLGRLNISKSGTKERDRMVLKMARQYGIPLTAVMGGGYSNSLREILDAHCNTYRLGQELFG